MLPKFFDYGTHCLILGRPNAGKTTLIRHCGLDHAIYENAFLWADLADGIDRFIADLAAFRCATPIWLYDLADAKQVLPWNFLKPQGDLHRQARRLANAFVAAWRENPATMPVYRQVMHAILMFCLELQEPIQHGAELLVKENTQLRHWALHKLRDADAKRTIMEIQSATSNHTAWRDLVGSTNRRLREFIGDPAMLRFIGLPEHRRTIRQIRENGEIALFKLPPGDQGRVSASILFSEILGDSLDHLEEEKPFFAYIDEAQEVVDDSTGQLLNLTRKSGLRISLSLHHPGEGRFANNPSLSDSIETACKVCFIFEGLPEHIAKRYAQNLKLHEINGNQIMAERAVHWTSHETVQDERGTHSLASSETDYEPIYAPMDLKMSRAAAEIMQPGRFKCWLSTPDGTELYEVPYVDDWRAILPPDELAKFREGVLVNAIPSHEADRIISDNYARFRKRYGGDDDRGTQKREVHLPPRS